MTRGQLVDAVQLRCFAGQNLWETNIQTIINTVVTEIARGTYMDQGVLKIHYWNDLKNLNQQTLAAAAWTLDFTNNRAIKKVRIANSDNDYTTLREKSLEEFRVDHPYPEESGGRPSYFTMLGDQMLFDCKADEAYTVKTDRYVWPTDMSADSNTPTITNIDDVIIAKSCAEVFAAKQEHDLGPGWFVRGNELYAQAIHADASKRFADGPVQFTPR